MSKQIRFLMVGGFLGSGKTTAIARIARHYLEQGLRVGLVTNDQATDLVDTLSLRSQGFLVGEVPGACFCCNINRLLATLETLQADGIPDVIVAEPVGSSADLIATVIEPLEQLHGDRYAVGPLTVLLKPEHGRKILRQQARGGFSPQAAYIFLKQIEEADVLALNKIDRMTDEQRNDLLQLVRQRYPEKQLVAVSALEGDGFDELLELLERPLPAERARIELDHATCVAGEAELGWLNCHLTATRAGSPFALDQLAQAIAVAVASRLADERAETAHLKVLARHEDAVTIANLVAADADVELSRTTPCQTSAAQVILNARVAADPKRLKAIACASVNEVAELHGISLKMGELRCFSPGRPTPTYRIRH